MDNVISKEKLSPTQRFSNRVNNYIKYRPGYPEGIIKYLKTKNVLKSDSIIADIGSGTGKLTEIFLKNGNLVYGIEPNKEMRKGGEKFLKKYKYFISIDGTAENTKISSNSINIVTAGQAFHWFDLKKTKNEFKRILKKDGYVVLVWNGRVIDTSKAYSLMKDYEKILLEFGTDYQKVRQTAINKKTFKRFFKEKYEVKKFPNHEIFDFKGLKGRLLSSSYIPIVQGKRYNLMIKNLKSIFNKYERNGIIKFDYICEVYIGKI
jgi:ubiquinone/menaquinone biosynthesis C-methylase UbiE